MRPIEDMLRGKRAAIFDWDGTLADSIGVWNETDRLLARELGRGAPDEAELQALRDGALLRFRREKNPYLMYCGLLRERYGTDMTPEEIYRRRYAIAQELLEKLDYKPGADALLRGLKRAGYILILATTTRRRSIELYETRNGNIMKKAPLDRIFDGVYTCEDVERIKPDPEIYHRIFRDRGLTADQCVVFEDSLAGIRAAKAAGVEVCVVYDRHADPDREALDRLGDWRTADLFALTKALGLG